nr:hypothetical protein [Tanacetum cinerariifolium]
MFVVAPHVLGCTTHSIVPSPVSLPMIPLIVPSLVASLVTAETEGFLTELGARVEMHGGLIRDHTVRLKELSPDMFESYDRDIEELFTRKDNRKVRDREWSQGKLEGIVVIKFEI